MELLDAAEKNKTQIQFIDRDPTYFNYILDHLRDPNEELTLPDDDFFLKKILKEAKYFLIDSLVNKIETHLLLHTSTINSLILNKDQVKDLINLCGFTDKQKWKLLYRASNHGFSAANFHSKCDGQSNTLTIIRTTLGYVFGGFTTKPWSQIGSHVNDPAAFIFSLINSQGTQKKFDCQDPEHAIYCVCEYGPTFGAGFDIVICDNSNQNQLSESNLNSYIPKIPYKNNLSYASCRSRPHLRNQSISHPNNTFTNQYNQVYLADSNNFQTDEIEVFILEY